MVTKLEVSSTDIITVKAFRSETNKWTSEDRAREGDGNLWEPRAIWRLPWVLLKKVDGCTFQDPGFLERIGSKWLEPKLKASPESFLAHAWDLFLDFSQSLLSTSSSRSPIQLAGTFLTLAVFCLMSFQQETGQKEAHFLGGQEREICRGFSS